MPTATFPKNFNGLKFVPIYPMNATKFVKKTKFVALPVPEFMGYSKMGSPWIRPRSLFSKMFNGLLFGWTL